MEQSDIQRTEQITAQQGQMEDSQRNLSGNSAGDGKAMGIKRKPGRPYAEPTQPVSVRLTKAQHAKYIELGGARWLKRMLDELNVK